MSRENRSAALSEVRSLVLDNSRIDLRGFRGTANHVDEGVRRAWNWLSQI